MGNLIDEKDMLRESDRVAVDVINYDVRSSFMTMLELLSQGAGIGTDMGGCGFWEDLGESNDDYYEPFDGVEFYDGPQFDGEEPKSIVLSVEDTYYYLKVASKAYIEEYPERAQRVEELLEAYRKNFDIHEKV